MDASHQVEPRESPAGRGDVLRRLGRVEGQVRGIARMVDEGRDCIDVLQQISAAEAALDRVALTLADRHVRGCLLDAAPVNRDAMQTELMATLGRLVGRR